jgi:hypothetical protein
MKNFFNSLNVAMLGLITSVAVAFGVAFLQNSTDFNLFSYFFWFIVPVGAFACGLAAASGYALGAIIFQTRANLWLFLLMLVITALTQILIYYFEYSSAKFTNGQSVSQSLDFWEYLNRMLTETHYQVGRRGRDTGEVGNFGYVLAGLQFVAFVIGSLAVFVWLLTKPYCATCQKYYRKLAKTEKMFPDEDSYAAYHKALFAKPIGSPEFKEDLKAEKNLPLAEQQKGAIELSLILLGCPKCKGQQIESELQVFDGNDWEHKASHNHETKVPEGVDLAASFK